MLQKAADAVEARRDIVERVLSLDTGNALRTQARPETGSAIDLTRMFGGLAGELKGETVPAASPNVLHYTTRDPIGVVAGIIPWNAPLFLFVAKIAPAIAAGNSVVVKTAEQAPFCVLLMAEILNTELPPGVLNVISGYGEECGRPLVEHPVVRKVTFTGSLAVGQAIAAYAAPKLCPVTLELGGKNPSIVLADADLDLAIPGIIDGMRYTRQGQACTAASRVFIHEKVYDRVVEGVAKKLADIKLGDPLDEATDMGAIISAEQFERTLRYMEIAKNYAGCADDLRRRDTIRSDAGEGLLLPADLPRRARPRVEGLPGRNLRSRCHRSALPRFRRDDRSGQRHTLRSIGQSLDARPVEGAGIHRTDRGRFRAGQPVRGAALERVLWRA